MGIAVPIILLSCVINATAIMTIRIPMITGICAEQKRPLSKFMFVSACLAQLWAGFIPIGGNAGGYLAQNTIVENLGGVGTFTYFTNMIVKIPAILFVTPVVIWLTVKMAPDLYGHDSGYYRLCLSEAEHMVCLLPGSSGPGDHRNPVGQRSHTGHGEPGNLYHHRHHAAVHRSQVNGSRCAAGRYLQHRDRQYESPDDYGVHVHCVLYSDSICDNSAVNNAFKTLAALICVQNGYDARALMLTCQEASSNCYLTPMAAPAMTMGYEAGGYKMKDYLKMGILLCFIRFITFLVYVPVVFPLK